MFYLLTRRKTIGAEILYNVVCHSASAICSYENGLTSSERVSSKVRWYSCSLSEACGFRDSESSVTAKNFETGLNPLFLPPKKIASYALNRQPISTQKQSVQIFAARGQRTCDCLDFCMKVDIIVDESHTTPEEVILHSFDLTACQTRLIIGSDLRIEFPLLTLANKTLLCPSEDRIVMTNYMYRIVYLSRLPTQAAIDKYGKVPSWFGPFFN